jgi:hypothetical protein
LEALVVDVPAPLPTVDSTASTADKTVGEIVTGAEAPVEAAIITAEPFMGLFLWKQLWEAALDWIFGLLGGALGVLTGYMVLDIQKYLALKNAASALATLRSAQASGDQNAIANANTQADAAIAPILHFVGTA